MSRSGKALGVETVQMGIGRIGEANFDLDGIIPGEVDRHGKLLHDLDLFEPIKTKIDADYLYLEPVQV